MKTIQMDFDEYLNTRREGYIDALRDAIDFLRSGKPFYEWSDKGELTDYSSVIFSKEWQFFLIAFGRGNEWSREIYEKKP